MEEGLAGGSEPELGLDQTTEHMACLAWSCELAIRPAQVEDRRGHADVVGDLAVVPPFPGEVAVLGSLAVAQRGDEHRLAYGHTRLIALDEHIRPLQADASRLTGRAVDRLVEARNRRLSRLRQGAVAPAEVDRGNPATGLRPPGQGGGEIVGVSRRVAGGAGDSRPGKFGNAAEVFAAMRIKANKKARLQGSRAETRRL